MTIQVNISPTGRMSLPAELRKRLGLNGGSTVFIEETADVLVLRTADHAVSCAQAIAKAFSAGMPAGDVDAMLARCRSTLSPPTEALPSSLDGCAPLLPRPRPPLRPFCLNSRQGMEKHRGRRAGEGRFDIIMAPHSGKVVV